VTWQPIKTASKDGTQVKLLCPEGEDCGYWEDYTERPWMMMPGEWSTDLGNGEPTHWKPILFHPHRAQALEGNTTRRRG